MGSWLLYSEDGQHLGPVPTEYVARAVKSGAVQANRWVTETGRMQWRPLAEVPEIRAMLESMSNLPVRDREHTMIASTGGFPNFPSPPITEKHPPSSDDVAASSERTLIAPSPSFEDEMAASSDEGPRTQALPGRDSDLAVTLQQNRPVPRAPVDEHGATLRSPDGPVLAPRPPAPVLIETETARMPGAPWPGPPKAEMVTAPRHTPAPHRAAIPTEPPRAERADAAGGSVLAFFLGGLALGAVVVVLVLVWAFRGGILR